ncbi:MAG TPA: sigma-70 family RNA polymerase sigma factor [Planctomycetota bacterium]|nr:sigma-70 family RNA polymerase sigma factor [Planctomycetota bacterium]
MAIETTAGRSGVSVAGLVLSAQAGDRAAFAQLYAAFGRVVHGVVLAHSGPRDAEDLVQEVFVACFQRLGELRDPAAFAGWLCAAARNAGVDALRRRQRTPVATPLVEVADTADTPVQAAEQRELAQRVLACVQQLPVAYREPLVLRLVEGLTGPEIAERTGLTHGSVRVNLTRGMALLRPLLQQAGLP